MATTVGIAGILARLLHVFPQLKFLRVAFLLSLLSGGIFRGLWLPCQTPRADAPFPWSAQSTLPPVPRAALRLAAPRPLYPSIAPPLITDPSLPGLHLRAIPRGRSILIPRATMPTPGSLLKQRSPC